MRVKVVISIAALTIGLAGCQKNQPEPTPAPPPGTNSATASQPAPAVEKKPVDGIELNPSSMSTCNTIEATVRWDVSKIDPKAKEVEIWVGDGKTSKIWMATTVAGEAKTGQWTSPGATFTVKNKGSGKELAHASMQGPACP